MKSSIIFRQVSYRMAIILFTVFAGAVSPLPEDFGGNFRGDPITSLPHDVLMQQVLYPKSALRSTVPDRTALRS